MGTPTVCVCLDRFSVDHAMICKHGGFIIQRYNELRDLEADLLDLVCSKRNYWRDLKQRCKLGPRRPPRHSCTWILGETKVDLFLYNAIQTLTHIKILRQNKCIAFMKTRRKERINVLYATSIHHNKRFGTRIFNIS